MTKIIFLTGDGKEQSVDATDGASIMEAAVANGIDAIPADCGGACACATCHVYVEAAFLERVGAPNEMEEAMLDFDEQRKPNSRLSCQIAVSPELDGIRLQIPGE